MMLRYFFITFLGQQPGSLISRILLRLLRYTSKILAEAFGRQGDFPLGKFPNAVTDAACNTKIMPVDSTLRGWLKF